MDLFLRSRLPLGHESDVLEAGDMTTTSPLVNVTQPPEALFEQVFSPPSSSPLV